MPINPSLEQTHVPYNFLKYNLYNSAICNRNVLNKINFCTIFICLAFHSLFGRQYLDGVFASVNMLQ